MKKKITINEEKFNKIFNKELNEISYGTVERVSSLNNIRFSNLENSFQDFLNELNDIIFRLKYNSFVSNPSNPYLNKIKEYADLIEDIFIKKRKQRDNFENELNKFDHEKFYDDMGDREDYTDYDELELRDLQSKYPK